MSDEVSEWITKNGNTLIPAYLVIQSKGYEVTWHRPNPIADPAKETWVAKGPLGTFTAEDAESVLGLITLRELRGSDWKASDSEIDQFVALYSP